MEVKLDAGFKVFVEQDLVLFDEVFTRAVVIFIRLDRLSFNVLLHFVVEGETKVVGHDVKAKAYRRVFGNAQLLHRVSELVDKVGPFLRGFLGLECIDIGVRDSHNDFIPLGKTHLSVRLDVGHCDSVWYQLRVWFAKGYLVDVKPYFFSLTLLLKDIVVGFWHLGALDTCSLEKLQ